MFQGSNSETKQDNFLDPAFAEGSLYNIQSSQCTQNSTLNVSVPLRDATSFQNGNSTYAYLCSFQSRTVDA